MYKKVLALFLAAVLLSGCDRGGGESHISSESSSSPINSVTSSEPLSNSSENTSPVETGGMPKEISDYIDSLDNGDFVFVDYTFNENPDLITDASLLGDIYDKALAVLKETDDYKSFAENYDNAELFGRFTENSEDFIDENGEPVPIFKRAIADDFDRDGVEETFVLIAIPKIREDYNEDR